MKMEFEANPCRCLQTAMWDVGEQEQVQELKLPEGYPDLGVILGAWGQPVLRSKEWRGTSVQLSGGIMAWIVYIPEAESAPRSIETWIPFQIRLEVPPVEREGILRTDLNLAAMDARTISARKIMLRASLTAQIETYTPTELLFRRAPQDPDGVELLRHTYPMQLATEAGEKTFLIEEDLVLPASAPEMEKLLRYDAHMEISDSKVLSQRLTFHGKMQLHLLYQAPGGELHSWDFDIPFSQYTELDREHASQAEASLVACLTSLELDQQESGLHLKSGAVAQYVLTDQILVEMVEDAYGIASSVTPRTESLSIPALLEHRREPVSISCTVPASASRIVDVHILYAPLRIDRDPSQGIFSGGGSARVLFYDADGILQCADGKWELSQTFAADSTSQLLARLHPAGKANVAAGSGIEMTADAWLELDVLCGNALTSVAELEIGDPLTPDPDRPSVILRRAMGESLWKLAKENGTTVQAICQANQLQGEPEAGQMLLIPVP